MSIRTGWKTVAAAGAGAGMLAAAVVAGSPASAATTAEQLAGERYVALGDSFAAGYGLPPYASTPAAGCLQSADSIAHRVAAAYGLVLTDVSCTGATIADITTTPQSVPGATVPIQLDAVTADTTLVTVSVGGNDAGFSTVLTSCAAASASGPLLDGSAASCAAKYGAQLTAGIQSVGPALDGMLAAIHRKAPDAKVIVLGYPALSPTDAGTPAGGCFSSALGTGRPPFPQNAFPFTDADRPLLAALSAQLDAAQRASAARNGAAFVSVLDASDAHTPCAGTAAPYLNGVTLTSLQPPAVAEGSMHPNAAGAAFLTDQLRAAIDAAFPATAVTPGGTDATGTAPSSSSSSSDAAPTSVAGRTAVLAESGSETAPLVASGAALLAIGALLLFRTRVRSLVRHHRAAQGK